MITDNTPSIITPEMIRAHLRANGIEPKKRSTKEFLRRAQIHALPTLDGKRFDSATDIDSLIYGG